MPDGPPGQKGRRRTSTTPQATGQRLRDREKRDAVGFLKFVPFVGQAMDIREEIQARSKPNKAGIAQASTSGSGFKEGQNARRGTRPD